MCCGRRVTVTVWLFPAEEEERKKNGRIPKGKEEEGEGEEEACGRVRKGSGYLWYSINTPSSPKTNGSAKREREKVKNRGR